MKLVVLYGAPAVGKLTVGRELSRLTSFKLFDNPTRNDAVRSVFDYSHASMSEIRKLV